MKHFEDPMRPRKGDGHRGKGGAGAKTFRRGRAMDFLERLQVKRITLKQQLAAAEFQEINQVILGELKAIEMVIDEFIKHFELHEGEQDREKRKKQLETKDDNN
ncbi:hypothetical protein [Niallia sp.]|uniref:hypothetical protein n=1 Tax=Niallia sp. TaxID=2837523 RepID=UPI0037C6E0A8